MRNTTGNHISITKWAKRENKKENLEVIGNYSRINIFQNDIPKYISTSALIDLGEKDLNSIGNGAVEI